MTRISKSWDTLVLYVCADIWQILNNRDTQQAGIWKNYIIIINTVTVTS